VEPDLLIRTSKTEREGRIIQKCQALWKVTNCPLNRIVYSNAQKRLIAHYDSDKGVVDLRRVLRMPGTFQIKNRDNPQLVTFEHFYIRDAYRSLPKLLRGLSKIEPARKPVARAVDHAAASHPVNIAEARHAFERICKRYRDQGGIPEGGRHLAM